MMSRILTIISLIVLSACQIKTRNDSTAGETPTSVRVDPKYSLSKDRAEFDELRSAIPTDVKRQNDEKALMAEWFVDVKLKPEVIREKFDSLVRKKRERFNKDIAKKREDFSKAERKSREDFTKQLEDERKDFLGQKVDRERRASFFDDQDERRREFFAEQREKRDEFESDTREERKNFDDYMKEKQDDFNSELSSYRIKWNEKQ